jgi:hypothetical protein
MVRNWIPSFPFFFRKWFRTESWSFLFWKWFGKDFQGFIIETGLEWNGFSLPRNGSERNSEVFLFRGTDGIPTELPSIPSCFVFRGIIFCRKMATLHCPPPPHAHFTPLLARCGAEGWVVTFSCNVNAWRDLWRVGWGISLYLKHGGRGLAIEQ